MAQQPRRRAAGAGEEEAPARPAYYVARVDVFTPVAEDRMQVCAFRAGDHVPADVYDANPEWQALLATPEDAEAASAAEEDTEQAPAGGSNSTGGGQGEEE